MIQRLEKGAAVPTSAAIIKGRLEDKVKNVETDAIAKAGAWLKDHRDDPTVKESRQRLL